jgi:hypothetical protein
MTDTYGYRSDWGNITRCDGLVDAVALWKTRGNGSICRLTSNGRWVTIDAISKWKKAREKTALHTLGWLISRGYSETGTDVPVDCADLFGSYWWPIVRDSVLERDDHKCRLCGSDGQHVHHILPRHCGGADNPINLITVCTICHKKIHCHRQYEGLANHKSQTNLASFLEASQ